jgi:hypothetical protein
MNPTNLTPLKVLQNRKKRLKVKSDALMDALKEDSGYLLKNIIPLVGGSAMTTVTKGLLDVLPFFLKGKKSLIAGLLLRIIKKKIFRE